MQRYFASSENNLALLDEEQIFHISKVMRMKKDDEFELVSNRKIYLMKIISMNPFKAEVVEEIIEDHELNNEVTLVFAPIKGERIDLVLQKGTELGVSHFVLLNTSRTVVKIKKDTKLARYEKIILEASEQSKRSVLPSLTYIDKYEHLKLIEAKHKLIAYENVSGPTSSFLDEIDKVKENESIAILIGPEGGFSSNEVDYATKLDYKVVSLGKRILRAETASIYALSVLGALLEK